VNSSGLAAALNGGSGRSWKALALLRAAAGTTTPTTTAPRPFTTSPSPSSSAAAIAAETQTERAIADKIAAGLGGATSVRVQDTSGGCGTMYQIEVVASDFADKTKIKQHQLVAKLIAEDVKQWHGALGLGEGGFEGGGARGERDASWEAPPPRLGRLELNLPLLPFGARHRQASSWLPKPLDAAARGFLYIALRVYISAV